MIDAYHLYLNASEAVLRRQTGWGRWRRIEELARWPWRADDVHSLNLEAPVRRRHRAATLSVYMGSALGKFMVLPLPAGLHDAAETRAAAEAHMQHQLGLQSGQWTFSVDRLPDGARALACALRADVCAHVSALARARGLRLVSLRPFIAPAWNALQAEADGAAAGGCALMLVEDDAYTIVIEKDGVIASISALAHRREAELIDREMRRLAYALDDETQRHLRLAVAHALQPLAQAHVEKVLTRAQCLAQPSYADFRDLLFPAPQQEDA